MISKTSHALKGLNTKDVTTSNISSFNAKFSNRTSLQDGIQSTSARELFKKNSSLRQSVPLVGGAQPLKYAADPQLLA